MSLSDEECVRLCLDGSREMFRHLVVRYQAPVVRYLCGKLHNESDASEAAQETMVRAYFALDKLKKPSAFFSWLLGIADRVAKEVARSRKREVPTQEMEDLSDAIETYVGQNDHQDLGRLWSAIAELPEAQRQVILLRFYAGMPCDEIGRRLGISLGTVTSRLSRAYALLRKAFSPRPQEHNLESGP